MSSDALFGDAEVKYVSAEAVRADDDSAPPVARASVEARHDTGFEPTGDGGASLVFWMLIALGLTVFTPCMILPAWRSYQQAEMGERARQQEVAEARLQVERLERHVRAVREDPLVIARLAQRELRCRAPGDADVRMSAAALDELAHPERVRQSEYLGVDLSKDTAQSLEPRDPPLIVSRLIKYRPNLNYDGLFCESPTREILLAMSLALVVAAFTVFWPRQTSY